jgi:hypothetical protein
MEGLLPWEALRPQKKPSGGSKKVRELEKQLRRKDKALAEAAALLVLQKKTQAIWGDAIKQEVRVSPISSPMR